MVPSGDGPNEPPKTLLRPSANRLGTQRKVVRSDRVRRLRCGQVLAITASPTTRRAQVVQRCERLKANSPPGRSKSIGEFSFESVCNLHEIFIKTSQV